LDPCFTITDIQVALPTATDTDYAKQALFVFPHASVNPQKCMQHAVYTCTYKEGPAGQDSPDLCNVDFKDGDITSNVFFDSAAGSLSFLTNDAETFPPGKHVFAVTITVGQATKTIEFVLFLQATCGGYDLTLLQEPAATYTYNLGTTRSYLVEAQLA
jgi:hypothetical protein